MRTDMTKLVVAFRNCANAPKNSRQPYSAEVGIFYKCVPCHLAYYHYNLAVFVLRYCRNKYAVNNNNTDYTTQVLLRSDIRTSIS